MKIKDTFGYFFLETKGFRELIARKLSLDLRPELKDNMLNLVHNDKLPLFHIGSSLIIACQKVELPDDLSFLVSLENTSAHWQFGTSVIRYIKNGHNFYVLNATRLEKKDEVNQCFQQVDVFGQRAPVCKGAYKLFLQLLLLMKFSPFPISSFMLEPSKEYAGKRFYDELYNNTSVGINIVDIKLPLRVTAWLDHGRFIMQKDLAEGNQGMLSWERL